MIFKTNCISYHRIKHFLVRNPFKYFGSVHTYLSENL